MYSSNYSNFFFVENNGKKKGFKEKIRIASPELLQVFHFDMIEGTDKALEEPNSVIIPESMALRLFGSGSVMDKPLLSSFKYGQPDIVRGVYKDFPLNSSLQNIIYKAMNPKENYNAWRSNNYNFFIRLDDDANRENVVEDFKMALDNKLLGGEEFEKGSGFNMDLRLTALPELHYLKDTYFDTIPKVSRQTMIVLLAIAFVILAIAVINFMNFSTALMPMRIKSINTQKVLGNSNARLRGGLLGESVCISVLAYLISLGFLYIVMKTSITSLVDADVSFSSQAGLIAGTGGLAILIGIISGLYPAAYITSFPPAFVLKGNFGLSPTGRRLRSILVGVQFVLVRRLSLVGKFRLSYTHILLGIHPGTCDRRFHHFYNRYVSKLACGKRKSGE